MDRSEFINWVETNFEKDGQGDCYWRRLVDYAECVWDTIEVEEDKVIFKCEKWYWGGIDYQVNEYSFEEFIERYENYTLKYSYDC